MNFSIDGNKRLTDVQIHSSVKGVKESSFGHCFSGHNSGSYGVFDAWQYSRIYG